MEVGYSHSNPTVFGVNFVESLIHSFSADRGCLNVEISQPIFKFITFLIHLLGSDGFCVCWGNEKVNSRNVVG